jgi:hypothetical protein
MALNSWQINNFTDWTYFVDHTVQRLAMPKIFSDYGYFFKNRKTVALPIDFEQSSQPAKSAADSSIL